MCNYKSTICILLTCMRYTKLILVYHDFNVLMGEDLFRLDARKKLAKNIQRTILQCDVSVQDIEASLFAVHMSDEQVQSIAFARDFFRVRNYPLP